MIDSKLFKGTAAQKHETSEAAALQALNAWREENPSARVISIETVASDHPSTMTSAGGYEFHGLRLWFETATATSRDSPVRGPRKILSTGSAGKSVHKL